MFAHVLKRFFDFHEDEIPRALWLGSAIGSSTFVACLVRNYTDAALLERYGPHYVPWLLLAGSFLTIAGATLISYLDKTIPQYKQYAGLRFIIAGCTLVLYLLVEAQVKESLLIARLLLYLYVSLAAIYVWNLSGDLFDTRQSKRIFPFVTATFTIFHALGSILTKPIWSLIGGPSILIIASAVWVSSALYISRSGWKFFGDHRRAPKNDSTQAKTRVRDLLKLMESYPIVRYLVIGAILSNFLVPVLHYLFMSIAHETYRYEHFLVTFFSLFRAATALASFALISALKKIYSKMDLPTAALVAPINFSVVFLAIGAFFNILAGIYAKFSTQLILNSISSPVQANLFSLMPSSAAPWLRSYIRGACQKFGAILGCCFLLVVKHLISDQAIAMIIQIPVILWIIESYFFRIKFKGILRSKLQEIIKNVDSPNGTRTRKERPVFVEKFHPNQRPVSQWIDDFKESERNGNDYINRELIKVYQYLAIYHSLGELDPSPGISDLKTWIRNENARRLGAILETLAAKNQDVALCHKALSYSEHAVAIELLQLSIDRDLSVRLIPLLDGSAIESKIQAGERIFGVKLQHDPKSALKSL